MSHKNSEKLITSIQLQGFLLQLFAKKIKQSTNELVTSKETFPKKEFKIDTDLKSFDSKLCIEYQKEYIPNLDSIKLQIRILTYQSKPVIDFDMSFKNNSYHEASFTIQDDKLTTYGLIQFLEEHEAIILEKLFQ